tara:strand:- start:6925 stop:7083 length:159 start_codon:yes stop_codon:yes gene_type:complete
MSGTENRTTANTQVVIGNAHIAQDAIQDLITAGRTIVNIKQVKAAVWLIIFN